MNSTILMTMKGQWVSKLIMANTSRWVTVQSVSVYQTVFDTRKHENVNYSSICRAGYRREYEPITYIMSEVDGNCCVNNVFSRHVSWFRGGCTLKSMSLESHKGEPSINLCSGTVSVFPAELFARSNWIPAQNGAENLDSRVQSPVQGHSSIPNRTAKLFEKGQGLRQALATSVLGLALDANNLGPDALVRI
jgi:hypothetical protein